MPIKFIKYTKEQMRNMKVTAFSLYVNTNHYCIYESIYKVIKEAKRYEAFNDVEIYPVLGVNHGKS